jgi:hypothetical protein
MRVGIIQSCYVPWRGFFDFVASVDTFVLYDDVQYSTGSWRNRNQIKTKAGLKWITVPVQPGAGKLPIDEVRIGTTSDPWQVRHRASLNDAFRSSAYRSDAIDLWEDAIKHMDTRLSVLNKRLIVGVCLYLGIGTPIILSRPYGAFGSKTDRLIDLLKKLGATSYLSGANADAYLDKEAFRLNGIRLEYKSYDYDSYPQPWGGFEGAVTVLDLIANCGPDARAYLPSKTKNRVIVP